ncbi:MAG: right-handed parallel beta-helix repeat-containing protein [Clostridium sp.]|nr:right-handed parallel beta-helix repeat-containing protein [Clostridium sp.]
MGRNKKISEKTIAAALIASMVVIPGINTTAVSYLSNAASTSTVTAGKVATSSKVFVVESKGDLETAYAEWQGVSNATGYNVYYKASGEEDNKYKQIDNELIRQYSSYFRADVIGLKEGNYTLKIVPIINGSEDKEKAAVTDSLSVKANNREGFAFSKESPNGTASGGYNDDGTVPSNAEIIYVTKDTANTVTNDVVTNSKGTKTTCVGLTNILAARQKGYDKTPLIIRMVGEVKASDISGLNSSGYIQLKGCYNVTFEGVGEDATANGWGFLIRDVNNLELRNIGVMLFPDDGISLDTNNTNVWVHNNDIFYGTAGSDKDQAKGDGSTDVKGKSDYVTVSYNHYYDSGKCSLCGMGDSEEFHVTYHHNWFDHSDSRHPRIRVGTVHIYNNYFDGNAKYGVGVTKGSSAFVEGNYFRNCKNPMLISRQGTDVFYDTKGTFSGEAGGMIKAYNNHIEGAKRLVYANDDATQFDAYLASTRDEKVPSSYKTVSGGTNYNNFDTAASMYSYNVDSPEEAKEKVMSYAGRVNGGDFSWQFTEADDESYSLNADLMAKIKAYKSDVVSIGGNSIKEIASVPEEKEDPVKPEEPTKSEETNTASAVHNFTTDGLKSSFFNIKGSLSTSKGSTTYNGLSLTQCLKVESSTSITFTTTKEAELTLVFNDGFNKNIMIDGSKVTASNGILTTKLAAGEHSIAKVDSGNIFYMAVSYGDKEVTPTEPTKPENPTKPEKPETPAEDVNIGKIEATGMTTGLMNADDSAFEGVVYAAPNGNASNDGTYAKPLDLESALQNVAEGKASSILLEEGTYSFDHVLTINNSGTKDAYNVLKGCKGAKVVLDFSSEAYNTKDTSLNARGIQMNANYWYIANITIKGAADNGMMLSGSHNVIERCIFDGNRDTGLQISRRSSSVTNYNEWPSYNKILNCTSKNNCDPATYENADGFASKLTCGDGNVFDGCISYNNSDDGWDLFAKSATGPIGIVTIRNCIAMRNGMTEDGTTKSSCDGNGFKLGGSGVGTPHVVENCIAIENLHHGFTDNNNPEAIKVVNCTAFDNNKGGGKNNFSLYRCKGAFASNCISYTTNGTSDKYVNLTGDHLILNNSKKWYKVTDAQAMDTGSSVTRGEAISTGVEASDFVSTNIAKVGTDFDKLWRNEDGTINTNGAAIVSSSSKYATFSSDEGIIGARFSANNKVNTLAVNVKKSSR